MIFEKIRERLEEEKQRLRCLRNDCIALSDSEVCAIEEKAYNFCKEIVNQVEAECNNDMVYQLAMKYALCLTQYGVDITEKLETATQNAMALEQAYIRGRQDECDKFSELRDIHNNGWIYCSSGQMPKDDDYILYCGNHLANMEVDCCIGEWFLNHLEYMLAWQPLPQPPKGE